MTLSTSVKYSSVKHRVAEYISKQIGPVAPGLGVDFIHKVGICIVVGSIWRNLQLCEEMPEIRSMVHGKLEKESDQQERETLVGIEIGHFIRDVFKWFGDRNRRIPRKLIYKQYTDAALKAKINFKPTQWKFIRSTVVEMIVTHLAASAKEANGKGVVYTGNEVEECATRVFNQVLSEMRSGALCAVVEEKQKVRLGSICEINFSFSRLARNALSVQTLLQLLCPFTESLRESVTLSQCDSNTQHQWTVLHIQLSWERINSWFIMSDFCPFLLFPHLNYSFLLACSIHSICFIFWKHVAGCMGSLLEPRSKPFQTQVSEKNHAVPLLVSARFKKSFLWFLIYTIRWWQKNE